MSFFDRFRKKTDGAAAKKAAAATPSKELEAVKKQAEKQAAETSEAPLLKAQVGSELSFRLLRHPHVSEKAAHLTEKGTYVFDVPVNAEKISIKKAVEALYKVNVIKVRSIRHAGKPVYRGRRSGARKAWKKALVTLKKGQKIDLYEGV